MQSLTAVFVLVLIACLWGLPSHAQESAEECPYPEGQSIENLKAVLEDHAEWIQQEGWKDPTISGRANFCNAYLVDANLKRANLQAAELGGANLQEADLNEANLQGARLRQAFLEGAFLIYTNLQGADLGFANLQGAELGGANLQGADLNEANLQRAYLKLANLQGADLTRADLRQAILSRNDLSDAVLYQADLSGALYQPATAPAHGSLAGLVGLDSLWYCPGESSGLAQLREAFKLAGLRTQERVATSTLESIRTDYALARWNGLALEEEECSDLERDRLAAAEGVFRLVFFEWTTDYGLAYGRPLWILLGGIGVFTLIYLSVLLVPAKDFRASGIYRVWPQGRIEHEGGLPFTAENEIVERLRPSVWWVGPWALYFSVVSAFHLGWRDLNVGTWIARMQPREYALRAKGWVRVVSGLQSLISVFLIAMWVLTYFGRPFQ